MHTADIPSTTLKVPINLYVHCRLLAAAESVSQLSEQVKKFYESGMGDQMSKLIMKTVAIEKNYLPGVLADIQAI